MKFESKYPVFILVTMFFAAFAPGPRAWAQSAEALAREGNEHYKKGNYQKAVDAYRQAMIRNPENSLIKYNLGTAMAKAGDVAGAQKVLTEAAEVPGAARRRDAYYNKGVTLGEAGIAKPEAAAGQQQDPDALQAEMANVQQRIEMLTQSLDAFRKNILTDAKDENAIYNYETVLAQLRRLQKQMEQMKQESQNQQKQGGQNKQQQKGGQNGQNQKNGGGNQNGNQNQQGQQQNQEGQGEGGDQLKPEQVDANALLNLLEAEKPDQFKNLFRFRGGESNKSPRRDW